MSRPLSQESTMIEFEGKAKSPLNAILVYLGLFLAVAFVVFILMSDRSVKAQLESVNSELTTVKEELAKPSYANVIDESKAFENAVENLSELSAKKLSKAEILSELYKYFTKDVRINSFSISNDGLLAIDGVTSSYRSVADFIVGLESFPRASEVKLISVGMRSEEGVLDKERFSFNATAKINMEKIEKPVVDDPVSADDSVIEDSNIITTEVITDDSQPDPAETDSTATGDSAVTAPTASEVDTSNPYEGY